MNNSALETAEKEWAYLNRVYNLFVWGCVVAAWFTIAVMAYEIAAYRGWL